MNSPALFRSKARQLACMLIFMLFAAGAFCLTSTSYAAEPPKPLGAVPSERQLAWHNLEAYAFVHFGLNTFTDKEWGYGDESESLFNPSDFSADQIAQTVKDAGLKGIMLTCKHHDGFCLWPSQYTEHSIKKSPWKNGQGDLVREISDACRRHGLKFGVYLSPWDRNFKDYASPAYITYYRNQLRELLTNYGPIFEMWFDGANGGDGYYGGARERRRIDNKTYYDWPNTWQIVRELAPQACMFSDGGPDIRWVGNESGFAGETCWATVNRAGMYPGFADRKDLNEGVRGGTDWLPAEVDVSIRPGWFYHTSEDARVKTVPQLVKIYFESVGRGANLILNLPPDRRGRIHENDVESLRGWRKVLDETFAKDLAVGAIATAGNTRGGDSRFAPASVIDGKHETYWATDDAVTASELVLDLGQPQTFNVVRLREFLTLGQRVDSFALDAWRDGAWAEFAAGTSIGNQRLVLTRDVTTSKVRLRITQAAACPAISEVGLFRMPGEMRDQVLALGKGSANNAKAAGAAHAMKVVSASPSASGHEAARAVDGNPATFWQARPGARAELVIDLGKETLVKGFTCLPRQDGQAAGIPDQYACSVSADRKAWQPAATGEFSNIKANPIMQTVNFPKPVKARYVKFTATHLAEGDGATLAEFGVIPAR